MQYLIGAVFGAGIALFAVWLASRAGQPPVLEEPAPPEAGQNEALLRQWSNLLNYCGKEQHDED